MSAVSLPLSVASAAGAVVAAPVPDIDGSGAVFPAGSAGATDVGDATDAADFADAADVGSMAATVADAAPATAAEAFAARAATATAPVAATTTTTAHAGIAAPAPAPSTTAGSLGGAVFALVLVVGLILLLSWLAKRVPGLGGGGVANPALRIVGSLALGPRDRLVVVEVGETQLLLGVGAGGTRTLHTLEQPLPAAAAKSTPAFAQLLAQHFGKKP